MTDVVYVNQRGARANLVESDIIDLITVDYAICALKDRRINPLVGQFYVLDVPLEAWQILMHSKGWNSLSPGRVAIHEFTPVIAVCDPRLEEFIADPSSVAFAYLSRPRKIGEGVLRGEGGEVRLVFALF